MRFVKRFFNYFSQQLTIGLICDKMIFVEVRCDSQDGLYAAWYKHREVDTALEIKKTFVNAAIRVMSLLPLRKVIVFESSPDFACNAYPVYAEIKKNPNVLSDYRLMWLVDDGTSPAFEIDEKDLIYDDPKEFSKIIKNLYYRACAECFVMSNRVKNKVRKNQIFVFLCHGSKTKKTKQLYEIGDKVDYVLCQSHFFDEVICDEYNIKKEQLVYLGYPRCDALFENHRDLREVFGVSKDEKLVLWLPTYRKHKKAVKLSSGKEGLPLLNSVSDFEVLGQTLLSNKIKLIVKPHPAEDISVFGKYSIPNLSVITDGELSNRQVRLYELLSAADALVSDYSSVFYDWLLCNRPIALTADDKEAYKAERGFALDLDSLYDKAASRIENVGEFCSFLKNVADGNDENAPGREYVRDLTNIYRDGGSAARVVKFIEERIGS